MFVDGKAAGNLTSVWTAGSRRKCLDKRGTRSGETERTAGEVYLQDCEQKRWTDWNVIRSTGTDGFGSGGYCEGKIRAGSDCPFAVADFWQYHTLPIANLLQY